MASTLNAKTNFISIDVELHYESKKIEIIFNYNSP